MPVQNVRFPPDSTGKRVAHITHLDIVFSGGTIAFKVGDVVTTPTSLIFGTVIHVTGTVAAGEVFILLSPTSAAEAVNTGEALRVNGVTNAISTHAGVPIYVQKNVMTGGNNPTFTQHVDNLGAASVRFTEGSPRFDAFGKMQVSQSTTLGDYVLRYDGLSGQFQDTVSGVASITHNQAYSGIVLSTGTLVGASAQRTSHEYHTYQPGVSQLIEMTLAVGDAGKDGVIRAWGYGDDDNGLFFHMSGTVFHVLNRSKASGVVVEEVILRSAWNGDRLDGTRGLFNPSGLLLDITKDNIYWIDLQWLGAGRARFGVIIDGVRITVHSDFNANNQPFSYMSTASLPIRVEQFNTTAVASTSELKFFCSTVKTEGAFTPLRRVNVYETPGLIAVTSNTVAVTALMLRPMELFKGISNRVSIFAQTFEVYNAGPDPVVFEVVRNATETSGTYVTVDTGSAAEVSTNGVTSAGRLVHSIVILANTAKTVNFDAFINGRQGLRRNATASSGYSAQYYRFRTVEAAKTANVKLTAIWEEVVK